MEDTGKDIVGLLQVFEHYLVIGTDGIHEDGHGEIGRRCGGLGRGTFLQLTADNLCLDLYQCSYNGVGIEILCRSIGQGQYE